MFPLVIRREPDRKPEVKAGIAGYRYRNAFCDVLIILGDTVTDNCPFRHGRRYRLERNAFTDSAIQEFIEFSLEFP